MLKVFINCRYRGGQGKEVELIYGFFFLIFFFLAEDSE